MPDGKVNISISQEIFNRVVEYVQKSEGEFQSVEEFVEFCLREVLTEERPEGAHYSKEEEEQLKERFKALGYI